MGSIVLLLWYACKIRTSWSVDKEMSLQEHVVLDRSKQSTCSLWKTSGEIFCSHKCYRTIVFFLAVVLLLECAPSFNVSWIILRLFPGEDTRND